VKKTGGQKSHDTVPLSGLNNAPKTNEVFTSRGERVPQVRESHLDPRLKDFFQYVYGINKQG